MNYSDTAGRNGERERHAGHIHRCDGRGVDERGAEHFGSGYAARKADYSGTAVDLSSGNYPVRAESYRMIIEGRVIHFANQAVPRITWNCRLLNNAGDYI